MNIYFETKKLLLINNLIKHTTMDKWKIMRIV